MNKLAAFVFLVIIIQGCKKETSNQVPAPDTTPPPVTYNYNITLINDRPDDTDYDTLIVKINDVVKFKYYRVSVPKATEFKCKTGDKLYVYYNPGTTVYSKQTIIQSNKLMLYPDGGIMNPITFNGCRCTGVYSGVMK